MALACSELAASLEVEPANAATPAIYRTAALTTLPKMGLNRSHSLRRRIMPSPLPGNSKLVRGLEVTPASARAKVNGLNPRLVKLLAKVQAHYGRPLRIVSGCRSKAHNRRINGAKRSQHLHCKAADFQIPGVSKYKLAAYLKKMPGRGGVGTYCRSSFVHLDVGPKRQWHWKCAKRKKKQQRRTVRLYSNLTK